MSEEMSYRYEDHQQEPDAEDNRIECIGNQAQNVLSPYKMKYTMYNILALH